MLKHSKSFVKSINQAFLTCGISLLLPPLQTKRQKRQIFSSRSLKIRLMELDQMFRQ